MAGQKGKIMKKLGIEVLILAAICTIIGVGTAGLFIGILGVGALLSPGR